MAIDKGWIFLDTKCFKEIYKMCLDAFKHGVLYGLATAPGLGKSSAFAQFKKDYPNTYIVTLDKNYKSSDLYISMLHAVGVYDWTTGMSNKALSEKFADTIRQMDEPCLFIFDEAGLFTRDMLCYFHTIFDSTKGRLGMVLAGTDAFKRNVDKWVAKNKFSGVAELQSRMLDWKEIYSCSKHERQEVVVKNGISDLVLAKSIAAETKTFRDAYNRVIRERIRKFDGKNDKSPNSTASEPKSKINMAAKSALL